MSTTRTRHTSKRGHLRRFSRGIFDCIRGNGPQGNCNETSRAWHEHQAPCLPPERRCNFDATTALEHLCNSLRPNMDLGCAGNCTNCHDRMPRACWPGRGVRSCRQPTLASHTQNLFFFLSFLIRQKIKRADVGGCRRPVAAPPVAPRGRGKPTYATCQARPLERLGVAQASDCEHRFARNQRHRFLFDRQHPPCRGRGGDFQSMPAVEKLRTCSMQPGVEMLLFKFRQKIVDGKPQFVSRGPQNHDISI